MGQHGRGQIDRVAQQVADLDRYLARANIYEFQHRVAAASKLGAMAAGIADIFCQLDFRIGVADQMPCRGLCDGYGPIGGEPGAQHHRASQKRCLCSLHSDLSSLSVIVRASDSSTARISGSPISRKLSPNSIGIGLSDGGALAGVSADGGLTAPCRIFARDTALYPKKRFTRSIISGITCWISGAFAGTTTNCNMPSDFSPGGKRIASGAQTLACVGPTISGQRVTMELCTKPNRRKAVRPICGISSPIGFAVPPRRR